MQKDMRKLTLRTKWNRMKHILVRYMKFLGSSLVGTIVDLFVLWLMSDLIFKGRYWGEYLISPFISFQCSVFANFLVSYFYVWRDRVKAQQGKKRFMKLFFIYNLSSSSVFFVRILVLLGVEMLTGWDVILCNLLATAVSGFLNFILGNQLIFKTRKI